MFTLLVCFSGYYNLSEHKWLFYLSRLIIQTAFTDINLARESKNRLIHDYIDLPKYSKACAALDDGFEDAFQYTVQGNSHNRLKSTNLIERLNQEVRRREKIISNQTSANRLIGAVLMDLHDEWIHSSRKYINFDK